MVGAPSSPYLFLSPTSLVFSSYLDLCASSESGHSCLRALVSVLTVSYWNVLSSDIPMAHSCGFEFLVRCHLLHDVYLKKPI